MARQTNTRGSTKAREREAPRYSDRAVAYFPREARPALLVIGEAPGPRGANRTGYPFWGDDSGLDIYGLVESLGLMDAPFPRWKRGADISGTCPPGGRYCITNACPQMPLDPEGGFTAPPPERLVEESRRIADELRVLQPRAVLACGRAATFTLGQAALALGGPVPPELAGRRFQDVRMLELMQALLDAPEPWRVGGAVAFVTTHPSRGSWRPGSRSGALHAGVLERLRATVASPGT